MARGAVAHGKRMFAAAALIAVSALVTTTPALADKCCQCGSGVGGNIWGCVTITSGNCDDADCTALGCGAVYTNVQDNNDACPGNPTNVCGGISPGTCDKCANVVCAAQDQCHNTGTCNPSTGLCSNPTKTNGTACNDGDACTQSDTCQAGTCAGANPVVCAAQDQCHNAGTCDTGTGLCSNPVKGNGTACNDGNACTQSDTCQSGSCTGANPVQCSALDQCHEAGTCNTSTGQCSNPNAENGISCNNEACSGEATCQSGSCLCPGQKPSSTSAPLMSGPVLAFLALGLAALTVLRLRARPSR